ncbi:uncharacterized protein METZ01_LOCUS301982, partial [marine metagenome]
VNLKGKARFLVQALGLSEFSKERQEMVETQGQVNV